MENSTMTLETLNVMRQRILAGEEVSRKDLENAITFLRTGRAAAPAAKAAKETKPKAKAELLAILEDLK